jgi:hypothetical protein
MGSVAALACPLLQGSSRSPRALPAHRVREHEECHQEREGGGDCRKSHRCKAEAGDRTSPRHAQRLLAKHQRIGARPLGVGQQVDRHSIHCHILEGGGDVDYKGESRQRGDVRGSGIGQGDGEQAGHDYELAADEPGAPVCWQMKCKAIMHFANPLPI